MTVHSILQSQPIYFLNDLTFTVGTNCSIDLKLFVNSWPSYSNFKSFSDQQNNFFSQQVRTVLVTKYHFYLCMHCVGFFFLLVYLGLHLFDSLLLFDGLEYESMIISIKFIDFFLKKGIIFLLRSKIVVKIEDVHKKTFCSSFLQGISQQSGQSNS